MRNVKEFTKRKIVSNFRKSKIMSNSIQIYYGKNSNCNLFDGN